MDPRKFFSNHLRKQVILKVFRMSAFQTPHLDAFVLKEHSRYLWTRNSDLVDLSEMGNKGLLLFRAGQVLVNLPVSQRNTKIPRVVWLSTSERAPRGIWRGLTPKLYSRRPGLTVVALQV